MNDRIVVIGSGLIGSAVVDAAVADRVRPVAILSRSIPKRFDLNTEIETIGETLGSGRTSGLLQSGDTVICCYGSPDPRVAIGDAGQHMRSAIDAATELIEQAHGLRDLHVIFVSSAAVYGYHRSPISEDAPLDPTTGYGVVKAAEELALGLLRQLSGVTVTTLRCSTVVGMRAGGFSGHGLVQALIEAIDSESSIRLFANGREQRGYIAAADLAKTVLALVTAVPGPRHEIFNVCSGDVLTGLEVVDTVCEVIGKTVQVELLPGPAEDIILDTSRLRSEPALRDLRYVKLREQITGLVTR